MTLTIAVISALFVVEFVGQYIASRDSLNGLTELHQTIRTTGQVRRIRELTTAQLELLRKAAVAPLAEEERAVYNGAEEKIQELFLDCLELSRFQPEAYKLIADAKVTRQPLPEKALQILNRRGDVKAHLLVVGQYVLETQDLLGKVQLVLTADADRILNRVYSARFWPLTVGIVLATFCLLLALWMGFNLRRKITSPIENLVRTTKKLGAGDLTTRSPIEQNDEIGMLAHAFNTMAHDLEKSTVSKEYVESIVESMLNCVFVLDREGNILTANRLAAVTFGYAAAGEMTGGSISAILRTTEINRTSADFNIETVGVTRAGREFPVFVSVSPLKDRSGFSNDLRVCVMKDITEIKKFETEIRARNLALSVANQELEAFSYSVSHDLRAPLRVIDGFSQALLEDAGDKLGSENKNHLDRIRAGVQKMGQQIDAVLNLSRLSRSSMNLAAVNLSELGRNVAEELAKQNPDRKVQVIIQDNMVVQADALLMKVVLENLIGNAWKYTGKTENPSIEFGRTSKNGVAVYYVRDNGAGFDMAYAQKLFTPFQRLHSQSDFAGTGVGLASVKRVIHRHGGNIWAESREKSGATFYFTFEPIA